jgi:hypothetical protein
MVLLELLMFKDSALRFFAAFAVSIFNAKTAKCFAKYVKETLLTEAISIA